MKQRTSIIRGIASDEATLHEVIEHLSTRYQILAESFCCEDRYLIDEETLYLLLLSDDEIKLFFKKHLRSKITVGIIPNTLCPNAIKSYMLDDAPLKALEAIYSDEIDDGPIDLLLCNEEPVFNTVIIGNMHGLASTIYKKRSVFKRIKNFFISLTTINLKDYVLTTNKEQKVDTVAAGVMILEHSTKSYKKSAIKDELSRYDGKLNVLILAPTSIISYFYYLVITFFYHRFSFTHLPKSLGLLITSKLTIESSRPIEFTLDGRSVSSQEIVLEVVPRGLTILGRNDASATAEDQTNSDDDKETVKVQNLPKGEAKNLLMSKPLPLFKKAVEEDFKELFINLKQGALLAPPFIVLMVLSTILATTGLFQNSAPVIIGAMILAPLMAPIVSLAMGVVRGDQFLLKESSITLLAGIVLALLFSYLYTSVLPLNTITDEMRGRVHPNILDLTVAIVSGIAGAYASAKSELAKSMAGVAIAVALVPPLSVAGIGLSWADPEIIYGAFLLFSTNLVGITLAAALTFIVLGYAPLHRAKKGILLTTIFLVTVSIPLVFSFMIVIKQNDTLQRLESLRTITLATQTVELHVISVDQSQEKPFVVIELHSHTVLNQDDIVNVKKSIEHVLKKAILLHITPKIVIE